MKEIKANIVIQRPREVAFNFTINPRNTPKWIEWISLEEANEVPIKLGTLYTSHDKSGKKHELKVTELEPGEMFSMSTLDDSLHVRYTFKSLNLDSCSLEYFVWASTGEIPVSFTQQSVWAILNKLAQIMEEHKL